MEIIIVIAVFGFALWWVFLRTPADTTPPAVYKVETPPTVAPIVEEVKQTVEIVEGTITPIAAVTTVVVEEAVAVPAKKPRKPRTPRAETTPVKAVAKKAAPKKAAAVKAAPKTRSKKI